MFKDFISGSIDIELRCHIDRARVTGPNEVLIPVVAVKSDLGASCFLHETTVAEGRGHAPYENALEMNAFVALRDFYTPAYVRKPFE